MSSSTSRARREPGGGLRRRLRAALSYLHELTGEGAYAAYVAHAGRAHPGAEVLSEREFWRERYADEDANPGSRCC
ncbi:uncharacterized short protein YbdD (DUF466 family) [Mycolicibacterium mucogenicum 261Sha1.1M5]|uniref:YbdD/YjiX family protein n=1 Tax=Leucobacter aridicollis TaxID=283878 RepID=UPI000EB1DF10|nr:YbdD/YjiX family protein [Leucobacter aridicollis]MCS3428780.1 uncharacterized short protein YbdD (DUF466 family) [Leucobacter aridicollis]RKQ89947.1 uncharacterized short protein YbdD (DUF466 family) [Mycolicibacterium mucogenicum 261Sha1.1M5]